MAMMKKFNEYFFPEQEKEISSPGKDTYQITKEEMDKLEKLSKGQISQVEINGFIVSMPSEFDGKAFLVDKDGKHQKISFDGGYPEMAEAERKVLSIITGEVMLESKRHRRHK
jgi:hypothetical protein